MARNQKELIAELEAKIENLEGLLEYQKSLAEDLQDQVREQEEQLAQDRGIDTAFDIIAEYLVCDGWVWDWDKRDMVQGNTLQLQQQNVLNAICWALNNKLNQQREYFQKCKQQTESARASATASYGLENYEKAVRKLRQAELAGAAVKDLFEASLRAHANWLDKDFEQESYVEYAQKQLKRQKTEPTNAVEERMRQLDREARELGADIRKTVAKDVALNTDGVNTTPDQIDDIENDRWSIETHVNAA